MRVLLLLLLACDKGGDGAVADEADLDASADAPATHPDCSADEAAYPLSWEGTARPILLTYCAACHAAASPQRFGAPEGVSFDTEDEARTWGARIRARTIDIGDMPVGGGVFANDRFLLEAWLDCGNTAVASTGRASPG
jgi:uncharacterized membrane protein